MINTTDRNGAKIRMRVIVEPPSFHLPHKGLKRRAGFWGDILHYMSSISARESLLNSFCSDFLIPKPFTREHNAHILLTISREQLSPNECKNDKRNLIESDVRTFKRCHVDLSVLKVLMFISRVLK